MSQQILKTRDDIDPVYLESEATSGTQQDASFRLPADAKCSWAKAEEPFGPEKLRPRIEPWLTALVQSEHLSLLAGSGLTHAVHHIAAGSGAPGMDAVVFRTFNAEIAAEAKRVADAAGRRHGNLEDQIRVANALFRGLEVIASTRPDDAPENQQASDVRSNLREVLSSFAGSILQGEKTSFFPIQTNARRHSITWLAF